MEKLSQSKEIDDCGKSDSGDEITYITKAENIQKNKIASSSNENLNKCEGQRQNGDILDINSKELVLSLKCLHDDEPEDSKSNDSKNVSQSEKPEIQEVPELSLQCLHEDDLLTVNGIIMDNNTNKTHELSQDGNKLIIITELPSKIPSEQYSFIHLRNNWEGVHNFKITPYCPRDFKKSVGPVYCDQKKKLYVSKDCPFRILVSAKNVPKGSVIKVTAAFTQPENIRSVVQRCLLHVQQDYAKGSPACDHFVQCISESAVYERDADTGRCTLVVPYEPPQSGENHTTYLLKLTCFSSCSGGINRRPFVLIFSLEHNGTLLGRQMLDTKVCACPVRDFKLETGKENEQKVQNSLPDVISNSPVNLNTSANCYTINADDLELYQFLKQMKVFYETSAFVKEIYDSTSKS